MPEPAGTLLAFDFGLKYIGVATGQTITRTANPLTTVRATDGKPYWPAVDELITAWRPDVLIVGLPLNMDGTESDMSVNARQFADRLHGRYGLRTEMADERLTSFEARAEGEDDNHAAAARLIAEAWLQSESV